MTNMSRYGEREEFVGTDGMNLGEYIDSLRDEKDARIAALESELAAKGRELDAERARHNETNKMACRNYSSCEILQEDRDRERSRREALEREVRELMGRCFEAGGDVHWAGRQLKDILDRAAKDSTGSGSGDAAHRETAAQASSDPGVVISPQPEPRRDYPPRTQPKPWFGDEFKRAAEQGEPVGKVKIGWICSKQCSWADRSACFERYVGDPCPHCKSPIVDLLGEPAVAEQNEPHTPDAEPVDCPDCGGMGTVPGGCHPCVEPCGTCEMSGVVAAPKPDPRMSVSEAHLAGLQDELEAAQTSAKNWEALARDWQLKFINMRQWVHTLRQNALHGSDYVKVARVLTGKALKGDEAPGYDEVTAEVCAAAVRRGEA